MRGETNSAPTGGGLKVISSGTAAMGRLQASATILLVTTEPTGSPRVSTSIILFPGVTVSVGIGGIIKDFSLNSDGKTFSFGTSSEYVALG